MVDNHNQDIVHKQDLKERNWSEAIFSQKYKQFMKKCPLNVLKILPWYPGCDWGMWGGCCPGAEGGTIGFPAEGIVPVGGPCGVTVWGAVIGGCSVWVGEAVTGTLGAGAWGGGIIALEVSSSTGFCSSTGLSVSFSACGVVGSGVGDFGSSCCGNAGSSSTTGAWGVFTSSSGSLDSSSGIASIGTATSGSIISLGLIDWSTSIGWNIDLEIPSLIFS